MCDLSLAFCEFTQPALQVIRSISKPKSHEPRKENLWILECLLGFPAFQERPPSPLEAKVILESMNSEKKARVNLFHLASDVHVV